MNYYLQECDRASYKFLLFCHNDDNKNYKNVTESDWIFFEKDRLTSIMAGASISK
jgi:hypothetical protein